MTPLTLQRKRRIASLKKRKFENSLKQAAEYHKLMVQRVKEARERRSASIARRRQSAASKGDN